MKSEAAIVKGIIKWIRAHGGEVYKVHGNAYQRAGEPDLTGAIHFKGKWFHFKFEVKNAKGKPSALQVARLKQWHLHDKAVGIVRSVEDVIKVLETYALYKEGLPFIEAMDRVGLQDGHGIYPRLTEFKVV